MIWYEIAKGNIIPSELTNVDLVATGVNIMEFTSTENLYSNLELTKKAYKAMHDFHSEIIQFDPWDYIIESHVNIPYEPKSEELLRNDLKAIGWVMNNQVDETLNNDKEGLTKFIEDANRPLEQLVQEMNLGLLRVRTKGVDNHGSRKKFIKFMQKNNESYGEILLMMIKIFSNRLEVSDKDLIGKINWEQFELFYLIWDMYFKEKSILGNAKFHVNDWYDLLNMAYVGSNDLYWTLEKNPWLRLLSSQEKTSKYIYKHGH